MKNPTPRQIALLSSAILSAVFLLLLFILQASVAFGQWWWIVIATITFSTVSYFTLMYMLQHFIYRKVKVIYKTISDRKRVDRSIKEFTMRDNFLDEVEQEVRAWADDKSREIETLKRNEQYRREFIGNVSHELKTPIFNIQGYLHTLIDGGWKDQKIFLDYLYKAVKNTDRLSTIVEDLEAISLLESGSMSMDMRMFDIHKLSTEVFESLEMQADSSDITFGFKKGCDKPTQVYGDRERIRQVLVNLLTNSIKYSKENGQTLVGFYDMDNKVLVEVSDNGIGISKEHLPRLFERFYRVDKSRSRQIGGSGLGLAIVKHIIEAHGQSINVRSTPGEGSTFAFTLKKGR
jgi:two-component system, OmpR family, phosphate regulon sensor histidine kinase PhoR